MKGSSRFFIRFPHSDEEDICQRSRFTNYPRPRPMHNFPLCFLFLWPYLLHVLQSQPPDHSPLPCRSPPIHNLSCGWVPPVPIYSFRFPSQGYIFPPLEAIRDVSARVAAGVIQQVCGFVIQPNPPPNTVPRQEGKISATK